MDSYDAHDLYMKLDALEKRVNKLNKQVKLHDEALTICLKLTLSNVIEDAYFGKGEK